MDQNMDAITEELCSHSDLNKVATIEFYQCEPCNEILYSFNKTTLNLSFRMDQWNTFVRQLMDNFNVMESTGSDSLQCGECTILFSSKEELMKHKIANPLNCRKCFQVFSCPIKYKEHEEYHSKQKPYECDKCGKRYAEKTYYQKHLKMHENEPVNQNRVPFKSIESLKLRKRRFNVKRNFKCPLCPKSFACNNNLQTHIRVHTGEKPFQCGDCGKAFSDPSALKRHVIAIHTNIKDHKCDICGKAFAILDNLRRHYVIHTGERPYLCKICGERFKNPSQLKTHSRIHTGDSFKCETCGMGFFKKTDLNKHKKIHLPGYTPTKNNSLAKAACTTSKESPFPSIECSYCDKRFTYPSELKKHIVKHTKERNFECDVCDKKFTRSNHLFTHKKMHAGAGKPHKCDICGKGYWNKADRDKHRNSSVHKVNTGSDKQPFHCDVCGESFTDITKLRVHSKTHVGNKQNKCAVCDKTFSEASELVEHYQLHKKPEKCVICEKTFTNQAELRKHFQLHKKVKESTKKKDDISIGGNENSDKQITADKNGENKEQLDNIKDQPL